MNKLEYRVIWKREGLSMKRKRYPNKPMAERFMKIFGAEPWRMWEPNKGPNDYYCCAGGNYSECACDGLTMRQQADAKADGMPKLEWVRLECREVGKWEAYHLDERNLLSITSNTNE